jgi:hypothetical protein
MRQTGFARLTRMPRPHFSPEKGHFQPISALLLGFLLAALGVLAGCEADQPREYTEVAFKPLAAGPMGGMGSMPGGGAMPPMASPPADIKVTWKLPEGWVPKDSSNGMRIGSFAAMDPKLAQSGEIDPNAVDVSVVNLAGTAGGLEANIRRWMGQVGLKATAEEMAAFVKQAPRFKTATGQTGLFIDLTGMLSGDMTQSKTIYGAIVQTEEYTVFVKAMGDFAKVKEQKPQVAALAKSLRIEGLKP